MSQRSRYKKSREQWKQKAKERGDTNRYQQKELARVKKERDGLKKELKETKACLQQMETQSRQLAVQSKVDLVYLALQLFLVAHIGFRAVSRVLCVLAGPLGIQKAPCPQTIINWVTRLSLVRIQSASMLKGLPLPQAPFSNGLIWMIDISIALGTGKILTVLALDAHHHQLVQAAPGFQHVHCIGVRVADSWTGESIAAFLERLIAIMGRPTGYLKDGGTDLQRATHLLDEKGLGSPCIDDISHFIAGLLKWRYQEHPMFETFISACGSVSGKLKQTILACLIPPKVHTKARFMNVHRLVRWAHKLLKLSPSGGSARGSILSKLRECMDKLPLCRAFIKHFLDDAAPMLKCQEILKAKGISHATAAQCKSHIQTMPSAGVRDYFLLYLDCQLDIAKKIGLDEIGMPISSDPIESLYGLGKQHGVGETKDANRIAIRLPAFCGIPTRAEAEQVIKISVAEQQELTDRFISLTKQRRDVLGDQGTLDSISINHANTEALELIPGAKKRSNCPEIIDLPIGYVESPGPARICQSGYD